MNYATLFASLNLCLFFCVFPPPYSFLHAVLYACLTLNDTMGLQQMRRQIKQFLRDNTSTHIGRTCVSVEHSHSFPNCRL